MGKKWRTFSDKEIPGYTTFDLIVVARRAVCKANCLLMMGQAHKGAFPINHLPCGLNAKVRGLSEAKGNDGTEIKIREQLRLIMLSYKGSKQFWNRK